MTLSVGALIFAGLALASVFLGVGYLLGWCSHLGASSAAWENGRRVGIAEGFARGYEAQRVPAPSVPLYPANSMDIAHEFADCRENVRRGPWGGAA